MREISLDGSEQLGAVVGDRAVPEGQIEQGGSGPAVVLDAEDLLAIHPGRGEEVYGDRLAEHVLPLGVLPPLVEHGRVEPTRGKERLGRDGVHAGRAALFRGDEARTEADLEVRLRLERKGH